MKMIFYSAVLMLTPLLTMAQGGLVGGQGDANSPLGKFFAAITTFIGSVLIPLVMAIAIIAFMWGVVQYFIIGGADDEKRKSGKQLMIYSILGFVLIVAIYGIVNFIITVLGFESSSTITPPRLPGVTG
jgi:hypothetical protein